MRADPYAVREWICSRREHEAESSLSRLAFAQQHVCDTAHSQFGTWFGIFAGRNVEMFTKADSAKLQPPSIVDALQSILVQSFCEVVHIGGSTQ